MLKIPLSKLKFAKKLLNFDFFVLTNEGLSTKMPLLLVGGIPKRPTGADCKSAVFNFGGSNPPPSTISTFLRV